MLEISIDICLGLLILSLAMSSEDLVEILEIKLRKTGVSLSGAFNSETFLCQLQF